MKKKILIVGDYMWDWYQSACGQEISRLGLDVEEFRTFDFFWRWEENKPEPTIKSLFHKIQYVFLKGPILYNLNNELLKKVLNTRPDYIWFYNSTQIFSSTLDKIRKYLPKIILIQYSNDNPFRKNGKNAIWKLFKKNIKKHDIHFAYRYSNIDDYKRLGCKATYILKPYFIPAVDFPKDNVSKKHNSEVVFAGHYENDGRLEALELILKNNIDLKLFGGGWNNVLKKLPSSSLLKKQYPVYPAIGTNYQNVICGSKIALCFLSKLNQDSYTRRNFQIPAMKVTVLSEYSYELSQMFEENKEIVFFKNHNELIKKIKLLLKKEILNKNISEAGYKRVYNDKHDIHNRMRVFVNTLLKY